METRSEATAAVATPAEVTDAVEQMNALMCASQAEIFVLIRTVEADGFWKDDGAASLHAWVAHRCRLSIGLARAWVTVALALADLPALAAAHAAGLISFEQLRALVKIARPETDEYLAGQASGWSVEYTLDFCRQAKPPSDKEARSAHERRGVWWRWEDDRLTAQVRGLLTGDGAATVIKEVERRAAQMPKEVDGVPVPWHARCADALVQLAMASLREPADRSQAHLVVVHTTPDVLSKAGVGGFGNDDDDDTDLFGGRIDNGGHLSSSAVLRLLCDGTIQTQVEDEMGKVLGIGRTSQAIPRWLRRAIIYRDGRCRFPGCDLKIMQIHHLQHWGHDGPTNAPNLAGLCWFHHHLVHEGGWRVEGNAEVEALRFISPDGRTITETRPPLRSAVRRRAANAAHHLQPDPLPGMVA